MRKNLSVLLVIIISAIVCFGQVSSSQFSINGIKQEVTIRRDARGIPYIDAKNEADLYFAQGYVTASDRLWQMEMMRRVSRGELSEILGKLALDQDRQWRKYGFSQIAEDSLKTLDPAYKTALENYTRGVNAYIATLNDTNMPLEFKILSVKPREWKPTDTICIGKILTTALSSTWRNDLVRASLLKLTKEKFDDLIGPITPYDVILFGKDDQKTKASNFTVRNSYFDANSALSWADKFAKTEKQALEMVGLYAEELAASNNWVISGKRTLDGKPILANDPHLQATAPNIWYLTHLSTPTMRVSGVTVPGSPGIVLGHNESIAWGATNVGPDVQDLYTETFNDKGEYKTPDGWKFPVILKEEIKIRKGFASSETETEILEIVKTRNGTIITDEVGQKFALKWTAQNPQNQELEAFQRLNNAKNWTDFQNALKTYGGATQNFIYADVKGNIGWIAAGRVPIRKTGDGALPYDGSTSDGDWVGMIPFAELPMLYNPPSGFISTANQRIVGTTYKYQQFARDYASPWRARRIFDLLTSNAKSTIANSADIQRDAFSIPHSKLATDLLNNNGASGETLSLLRGWDGRMTADSKPALIVDEIRTCVANKIAKDNYPTPNWVIRERLMYKIIDQKPANWLPKQFANYGELYKSCDGEAIQTLTKKYGPDESKWTWGNYFKSNYFHPLASIPLIGGQFKIEQIGINGSGVTPNVGSSVSMRLVTSPGNWDETRHAIPLGQSGNPNSPHWKDSWNDWNLGKPQVFPFTILAVEKAAVETMVMKPNREE